MKKRYGIPFDLLPDIEKSILDLMEGLDSSVVDCLKDELKSDINAAFNVGLLSDEHATYLEDHFVFASVESLKRLQDFVEG